MIGKIERVPLREVWKHEEYDFSKWLGENIEILGDAIGINLENTEIEAAAGSFSVDIVAKDEEGNYVIIENQLEKSNHDHLGKVITYLTMWDAKIAIWIVKEPRAEHIKAINWLNESSNANFYMVKIEAIRIGDSEPAPLLTEIVGPSEEARIIGGQKRDLSEKEKVLSSFWESLLAKMEDRSKLFSGKVPSRGYFTSTGAGVSEFSYMFTVRKDSARVELWMFDRNIDKLDGMYNQLYSEQQTIENEFGDSLEWMPRKEGKGSCKIAKPISNGGYQTDIEKWPRIQDAMIDTMIRLERALKPYIEKLSIQIKHNGGQ